MSRHIEDLASFLSPVETPVDLESRVLKILVIKQKRSDYFNLGIFSLVHISSWVALVFSGYYLAGQLDRSGFAYYLKLAFSDSGLITNYWSAWLLTLAESLPVLGLISMLGALVLVLWSMSKTLINSQKLLLAN